MTTLEFELLLEDLIRDIKRITLADDLASYQARAEIASKIKEFEKNNSVII